MSTARSASAPASAHSSRPAAMSDRWAAAVAAVGIAPTYSDTS